MMENREATLKYIRAKNKVDREKGLYTHAVIYIVVNLIITGFKVWDVKHSWDSLSRELMSIDVLSVWVIWGIFLILHFLSFKFGRAWEERKIEELMEKELTNKTKDY